MVLKSLQGLGAYLARRIPRIITEVFAPPPVVTALVLVMAWHSTGFTADALKWALLAITFTSLIPTLVILRGVHGRHLTDHHIRERAQRPVPLLLGVVAVLAGVAVLAASGAPTEMTALVAAMGAGLGTATLITLAWKISLHVSVAAGALAILASVFGTWCYAFVPVVVLVAWARVRLGAHDVPQVVAGAILGVTVAATVFSLLR